MQLFKMLTSPYFLSFDEKLLPLCYYLNFQSSAKQRNKFIGDDDIALSNIDSVYHGI